MSTRDYFETTPFQAARYKVRRLDVSVRVLSQTEYVGSGKDYSIHAA